MHKQFLSKIFHIKMFTHFEKLRSSIENEAKKKNVCVSETWLEYVHKLFDELLYICFNLDSIFKIQMYWLKLYILDKALVFRYSRREAMSR